MLRYLDSPRDVLRDLPSDRRPAPYSVHTSMIRLADLFEAFAPHIAADLEWRDLLVYDLSQARLALQFSSLSDLALEPGDAAACFTTALGKRFLSFISESDLTRLVEDQADDRSSAVNVS